MLYVMSKNCILPKNLRLLTRPGCSLSPVLFKIALEAYKIYTNWEEGHETAIIHR